jgi:hypothetical protein
VLWKPADNPIPLSASEFHAQELPPDLLAADPMQLFPNARDAKAALSGLLLLAGHWDLCHTTAQDIASPEGSYWHAIVHRIEPDSSNAGYWFRRVGAHPIFAALHEKAAVLLEGSNVDWRLKPSWDPHLFITWCNEARAEPGSAKYLCAQQIQQAECQLLLSWCAAPTSTI